MHGEPLHKWSVKRVVCVNLHAWRTVMPIIGVMMVNMYRKNAKIPIHDIYFILPRLKINLKNLSSLGPIFSSWLHTYRSRRKESGLYRPKSTQKTHIWVDSVGELRRWHTWRAICANPSWICVLGIERPAFKANFAAIVVQIFPYIFSNCHVFINLGFLTTNYYSFHLPLYYML